MSGATVLARYQSVLAGTESRESAAAWAIALMELDLDADDDVTLEAVHGLALADASALGDDGQPYYLYPLTQIAEWRVELARTLERGRSAHDF